MRFRRESEVSSGQSRSYQSYTGVMSEKEAEVEFLSRDASCYLTQCQVINRSLTQKVFSKQHVDESYNSLLYIYVENESS